MQIEGEIEAISQKDGRGGVKINGKWINWFGPLPEQFNGKDTGDKVVVEYYEVVKGDKTYNNYGKPKVRQQVDMTPMVDAIKQLTQAIEALTSRIEAKPMKSEFMMTKEEVKPMKVYGRPLPDGWEDDRKDLESGQSQIGRTLKQLEMDDDRFKDD